MSKTIVLATDHAGFELKEHVKKFLLEKALFVLSFGWGFGWSVGRWVGRPVVWSVDAWLCSCGAGWWTAAAWACPSFRRSLLFRRLRKGC